MEDRGTDMADRARAVLERRYRRWLRLYPQGYRRERGEEILQTLLEVSRPGQRRPAGREIGALTLQALRTRANAADGAAGARPWLAALPLAGCLLLLVRLAQVLLLLAAALATGSGRTVGDVAAVAGSALPEVLALVAVHRRWYRIAIALAAAPALLGVVLTLVTGDLGGMAGNHPATVALDAVDRLVPAVLLLPLLARSAALGAPRRWQLGVPVVLAAPVVVAFVAQLWSTDPAVTGVLAALLPTLAGLTLAGILLWGILVDGRVALAAGLCMLSSSATLFGGMGAAALPVPWAALGIIGGAGLALAGAGTYRTRQQAAG